MQFRRVGLFCALMITLGGVSFAQMQIGDNTHLSGSGTIGFGYAGSFGNETISQHNTSVIGSGTFQGYYYNPNFLSFTFQPQYDRGQSSSSTAAITNNAGFSSGVNVFSGSHFPGSVSYNKTFSDSSQFGLPGDASLIASGANSNFGVTWSELLPNLPPVTVSFDQNSASSDIVGTIGTVKSSFRTFNVTSSYQKFGWGFNGSAGWGTSKSGLPDFVTGDSIESDGTYSNFSLGAGRRLPLRGSLSLNWSRTKYDNQVQNMENSGATNTSIANVMFNPFARFVVGGNVRYTTNLTGALAHDLLGNTTSLFLTPDFGSHSLSYSGNAGYSWKNVALQGYATNNVQYFRGIRYENTQYGGTVNFNYQKPLFGILHFAFGLVDTASKEGNDGLGLIGNVAMQRRFGAWETSADFAYSQDLQTLIAMYTTSSFSYGGSVRRRFGQSNFYWSNSLRQVRSGLTRQDGANNHSESISSTLSWRRYSGTFNFSQSAGTTVLTSSGILAPAPTTPLITKDFILFDGTSYGVGFGAAPIRRLTLSGGFSDTSGGTLANSLLASTHSRFYFGQAEYRMRKLAFRAGFNRVDQGVTTTGLPPTRLSSYYFSVSRWFNVF